MTTLFVSDLHLDQTRPAITRAFFDFLDREARKAEALYILGDFFEVWVGDDDDAPLARDVIDRLRRLKDDDVALYVMHGNRDFLLGERFATESGATLLPDPSVVELYGERVLLMHGDSLCTRDLDYMAFRRQARDSQWQAQLLAQPLTARRAFARQAREQSQGSNSLKAEDIMDVTPEAVEKVMTAHRVRRLIHGHTHRPARHAFQLAGEAAERIVLGDWGERGWVLRASAQGYELADFAIDT